MIPRVNASGHYRTKAISFYGWSNRDKIGALFSAVCVRQTDVVNNFRSTRISRRCSMNRSRLLVFVSLICLAPAAVIITRGDLTGAEAAAPTFSKDIAPIFAKNCMSCHRPGEIAPMSLMSYKEVRPWAKSIREKVIKREMPPWHADPAHGEWANDRRLSQKEIDAIVAWVDGGAPEGDSKDLPPPPKFP